MVVAQAGPQRRLPAFYLVHWKHSFKFTLNIVPGGDKWWSMLCNRNLGAQSPNLWGGRGHATQVPFGLPKVGPCAQPLRYEVIVGNKTWIAEKYARKFMYVRLYTLGVHGSTTKSP